MKMSMMENNVDKICKMYVNISLMLLFAIQCQKETNRSEGILFINCENLFILYEYTMLMSNDNCSTEQKQKATTKGCNIVLQINSHYNVQFDKQEDTKRRRTKEEKIAG